MAKTTKYEEKYIKANRTFPTANTVLLVIVVCIQIGLIFLAIFYQPTPQDLIHEYQVTVDPLEDGSLDIEYRFVWEALDTSEELTWVEIGMANENYMLYSDSVTDNIQSFSKYNSDGYVALRLYFREAYLGGDVVEFSFKVNQRDMLCKNDAGYFYEFIPCWFNAIQVEDYTFRWLIDTGKDYVQTGSLDYGEYKKMTVQYGANDFTGCETVKYASFDEEGAYNQLRSDKTTAVILCCLVILVLMIVELYIVDCYVSYNRGRGFLTGYGYHVHTYGRTNPYYRRARDKHIATHSSRGGRSGGCACACACACAGGGRAGCSQKDTYSKEH